MDAAVVLIMVLFGLLVSMWILSFLARRQITVATTLDPERAIEVCDRRFSRVGWRRVDGDGTLNYKPRGFEFRGAKPPTLSVNVFAPEGDTDFTLVRMWLSQWHTQWGMIAHVEKVFWERWTIPRALREAERAAPVQPSVASAKSASTDPQVPLTNPGLPNDDPKQLAYSMFHACGLTVLSWGAPPLDEHVQRLLTAAPVFRSTEVSDVGAGELPGLDGMWLGFEGPAGSLVAVFVTGGEGQTVIENLLKPVQQMPTEWNWAISTAGGNVPAGVAAIFAGAQMVPLWQVSSFAAQSLAGDQTAGVPTELATFEPPTTAFEPPTAAIRPEAVSPFAATQAAPIPPMAAPRPQSSKNPMLIAGAIVTVGVVAAAAIFALTRPDGSPRTASASGGQKAPPPAVDEVAPCDVAPLLQPQTVRFSNRGLTISTRITPGCESGDLLVNRGFRVTAVDDAGNNVASGVFDLGETPIAVGAGGTTVDFTYPAGTYWRTADAISGNLELTAHRDAYDTTPRSTTRPATEVTADKAGAPEDGGLEDAVQSALVDIAAADRSVIDATLLNVWQPQLSSKRPGLFADGITWTNSEILREHLAMRQQFPNARLLWSGDWPVYSDRTWWVTVSGVPFNTGEQALGWCADHNFDWEHCFAKMLSHTKGSDGTTMLQKR